MVSKQPHDHNLSKNCRMYLCKCFEGQSLRERIGGLEFYCVEQSKTANLAYHFILRQTLGERAAEILTRYDRPLPEPLVLQNIEAGQPDAHRKTIFAEGRGMNKRALQRAVYGIADRIGHQYGTARNQSAAERFGQNDHVRLDTKVVACEEWAGPIKTSLHLIQD